MLSRSCTATAAPFGAIVFVTLLSLPLRQLRKRLVVPFLGIGHFEFDPRPEPNIGQKPLKRDQTIPEAQTDADTKARLVRTTQDPGC